MSGSLFATGIGNGRTNQDYYGSVSSVFPDASPDLVSYAEQAAQANGVPVSLFLSQIGVESSWNTNAPGGLTQITPATAANPGFGLGSLNTSTPEAQIDSAAQYDAALYNATGSWGGALTAYNAGYGNWLNGTATPTAAYQNLIDQANNTYGQGFNGSGVPVNQASYATGPSGGSDYPLDAQANPYGASGWLQSINPAHWIVGLETWAENGAIKVAVILVGLVFLVAGLFILGGGKPRDVIALAAE
jgi:hypothetical protein